MGYITKLCVEKILDAVRIEEVIGDFVPLKKEGPNYKGKSPFTEEKTPSFVVSPVKQIFKDFSSGKGGTAVNFLMEKLNITFPEAIEHIAKKYSIEIEYENTEIAAKIKSENESKEKLRETLNAVYKLYRDEYAKIPEHHAARIEVEQKRQYTREDIIEWGIGYAPENFLYDKLKNSGKVQAGIDLGLIKEGQSQNKYDAYTERVIYPIHDANGLLVGLAGRSLKEKPRSKWINPSVDQANILYRKSKVLFGYHKAKEMIRKRNEVYLVEGYNDVIAWHKYGCENTVALSGTALSPAQLNMLKRLCDKIVFCLDPDKAGDAAVLRLLPDCLAMGFRVEVVNLPCDPDEFSRDDMVLRYLKDGHLNDILKSEGARVDGFKLLMQAHLVGDAIDRVKGTEFVSKILATIKDKPTRIIYESWLSDESKVSKKQIQDWIKEVDNKEKEEEEKSFVVKDWEIELPKEVTTPLEQLLPDIKKYGLYQSDNKIYVCAGGYSFSVSNFSIEILQHMNDEKFPKKLLRIKNTDNKEVIFDTNSENLNSLQQFFNAMTGQGNFLFKGDNKQLKLLLPYLMDKMGDGKKIDVLGWQPDAEIFVFNNKCIDDFGNEVPMDENGIIVYNNVHYYVPSANKIYKKAPNRFVAQKKFRVIENPTPFNTVLSEIKAVHRDHAISAILFVLASLFRDIIVKDIKAFPIFFLYGPGSSGKDELSRIIQSFTGDPQSSINLEGGASTMKAQIREFAQFRNGISQLSEYKRGDVKLDGMIKGLWDLNGYKRGNIESLVSTDEVAIEAAVILTGNEYPQPAPLIMRLLWNEMIKNEFSEAEMDKFDKLKDIVDKGLSGYSFELMKHRQMVKEKFARTQREWKVMISQAFPGAIARMVTNYSIIATMYTLFKDTIMFPFTQQEMLDYFRVCIDQQLTKINTSSVTTRFWDIFVTSLRGNKDDRLQANQVVAVEGTNLYINWKHTYSKIQRSWYIHFQESAPSNNSLLEALEKAGLIVEKLSKYAFRPGKPENGGIRTSAIRIDMNKLEEELMNDIVGSIMFQLNQQSIEQNGAGLFDPLQPPTAENDLEEFEKSPF